MRLPERFATNMKQLLGDEYEDYLKSFEQPYRQGLRVNTGKLTTEEFLRITPFGLEPIPWVSNGFYYTEESVTKHAHYNAGLYYIQEPSAMIPASRLPVEPGDCVLDLCAAPGGKATELGARLQGQGLLVANDLSSSRAKALLKNLELAGIGNMLVTSESPERLGTVFPAFFDKILIDAPCSGEGMFRKDSGMIKSWEQRGPEYYADIQLQILDTALGMLKPGGQLLYSTCTFAPRENEAVIKRMLEEHADLILDELSVKPPLSPGYLPGTIRVWPHKAPGEGHFAALLKKQDGPGRPKAQAAVSDPIPTEATEFINTIPALKRFGSTLICREQKLYLLPAGMAKLPKLRFLRTGLYLGEAKKRRFEPSQALAMWLNRHDYPASLDLPADDPRIHRYLKGETLMLTEHEGAAAKGWVLVCVDGYPVGWGKAVNGSLRNKIYPGWRLP